MTMLPFGQVAPVNRRVLAYVVDALIAAGLAIVLTIVVVVITVTAGPDGFLMAYSIGLGLMSLVMLAWLIVYTAMQGGAGSIGMRAQGLRLARADNGESLGFGKALVRNLVFGVTAWIVVGYFSPLFDGSGRFQGWHDKAAGALMLDARASAPAAPQASQTAATPPAPTTAMPIPPRPPMPGSAAPVPPAPMPPAPMQPAPPAPAAPAPVAPGPVPPAPVPPAAAGAGIADLDETVVAPAPAAPTDSLIAFVPGVTRDAAPVEPAPAPVPPAAEARVAPAAPVRPEPEPVQPSDDDVEDTRISIPGHRLVFTWDDGSRVTVSRRTVFGRNPSPEDGAVVVPVRDETLSLSKTHFEAASEVSGGWIMDRHSTNGMTIVRDGVRIACVPGERTRVRLGDVIEIGDRVVTIGGYA